MSQPMRNIASAWARRPESCPFVAHAATCMCHLGHPILMDIPPLTAESLRQEMTRKAAEAVAAAEPVCICDPDDSYGYDVRCHRHGHAAQIAGAESVHPLEEVLRSVEQEQDDLNGMREDTERDRILDRARAAITGPRQRDYGSPEPGFSRAGKMWAAVLGLETVTAEQVAMCMVALKVSRLAETPSHRDSWDDIAGYAALGGEVAATPGRYL